MREYRFLLARILSYKGRIVDFRLHILCSVLFMLYITFALETLATVKYIVAKYLFAPELQKGSW